MCLLEMKEFAKIFEDTLHIRSVTPLTKGTKATTFSTWLIDFLNRGFRRRLIVLWYSHHSEDCFEHDLGQFVNYWVEKWRCLDETIHL